MSAEKIKNLLKKLFQKRRSDVSLFIYGKFITLIFFYKLIQNIRGLKQKENSCLIIFPPSLGLGDLIIISRIVDIIKESGKYNLVKVAHLAPFLQIKDNENSFIKLNNINEIISYQTYILPSPSLLNLIISFLLGPKNCIGYIDRNEVNFTQKNKYSINYDDPYYFRLKPFKEFFKYKKDIKPYVWNKEDRSKLKFNSSYFSINNFLVKEFNTKNPKILVISTYNFYSKFRPKFITILNQIKESMKNQNNLFIVILGANAKKEIIYNYFLEKNLKQKIATLRIINLTGKLSIMNSLEVISESEKYIGANNGLANIAQMLGINCTLIFKGPEKSKKRKFSKFSKFIS